MAVKNEASLPGEFILAEANGKRSRDKVTIKSGQNLKAGDVCTADVTAGTVTGAARSGNTGNGTIGTLSAGAGAKEGVYVVTFVEPATNLGDFVVEDPEGENIGNGVVGTEFAGAVVFTISDGSTDFAAGDQFEVKVSQVTEKWVVLPNDGTKMAEGVIYAAVDASAADKSGVMVVRDAEVNTNELNWPSGISAANKDIAITQLSRRGIIVR